MTSADVYLQDPTIGAVPVLVVGHPATAATGAAPIAAPAIPGGIGLRAALDRAIATGRASYRGVLLALAVAAAARFVSDHYGAPAMLFALLFGIAFNFLANDERCEPGITLSSKTLLRTGVALLGFRLTIAMITYPIVTRLLGFDDAQTGFVIGATIHDVAQVVGAGYSVSGVAGGIATLVKLERVALLPVVLLSITLFCGNSEGKGGGLPTFLIGFVACVLLNSTAAVPSAVQAAATTASQWLLTVAIAALGVRTSIKSILRAGGHAASASMRRSGRGVERDQEDRRLSRA